MINILVNATFGDGCLSKDRGSYRINFSSTNPSVIAFKAKLIGGNVRSQKQDERAWGTKMIYSTSKAWHGEVNVNKIDLISRISLDDFYLWYLDDGAYHKTKHFANLNSQGLTLAEHIELQFHLWQSLGIETQLAADNKKDGRKFFYLRIKRNQMESLKPEIKAFASEHNIKGFEYKIGEASTTIEKAN